MPLHSTTVAALKRYVEAQRRQLGGQRADAFFVSDRGKPLPKRTVHGTFENLRTRLRWIARGGHVAPRIHDLRHTFICRSLLDCYHRNQLPDHIVDTLSTYVGHAKATDTYWYVTAIPALLALAGQRFAHATERGVS